MTAAATGSARVAQAGRNRSASRPLSVPESASARPIPAASAPLPATLATVAGSGPAVALPDVRAMHGNDKIRLLEWLCGNHPETVAAGVAALAAEVAARREAQRIRRNRRSTQRSRAKRRAAT